MFSSLSYGIFFSCFGLALSDDVADLTTPHDTILSHDTATSSFYLEQIIILVLDNVRQCYFGI